MTLRDSQGHMNSVIIENKSLAQGSIGMTTGFKMSNLSKYDSFDLQYPEEPVIMMKRSRAMQSDNTLHLPISPAFVNNYRTAKEPDVEPIVDYCRKMNIPFKDNEQRFYKLNTAYQ